MFEGLPEICYALNEVSGRMVIIKKGETGYYDPGVVDVGRGYKGTKEIVKEMNDRLDVTPAQAEAMFVGSMFGWDVPGANPEIYDEDGIVKEGINCDTIS